LDSHFILGQVRSAFQQEAKTPISLAQGFEAQFQSASEFGRFQDHSFPWVSGGFRGFPPRRLRCGASLDKWFQSSRFRIVKRLGFAGSLDLQRSYVIHLIHVGLALLAVAIGIFRSID